MAGQAVIAGFPAWSNRRAHLVKVCRQKNFVSRRVWQTSAIASENLISTAL
jgi:hypothetical protein